jgi:hypothetical protein
VPSQIYDSIYLSGWEYNRLLQDDPLEPRNSSLPGDILWNGGTELWMFRNLYCTKESLDEEKRCAEVQGWTTAKIFKELETEGILQSVDWKNLRESTKILLQQRHAQMRKDNSEDDIRSLIREKQTGDLEQLKLQLLKPIMEDQDLNCLQSLSPNSLNTWKLGTGEIDIEKARVEEFLASLAAPIDPQQQYTGIRLCNPPGTGLSTTERVEQRRVELEVEAPIIADVVAADEPYAGESGHRFYMEILMKHKEVYLPIDQQLMSEWVQNRSTFLRLRDAAEKHLWDNLHKDWLPNLMDKEKGGKFAKEFPRLLNRAILHSSIADRLNVCTAIAFSFGVPAVAIISRLLKEFTNLPDIDIDLISKTAGSLSGSAFGFIHAKMVSNIKQLALFYQKARKITSQ